MMKKTLLTITLIAASIICANAQMQGNIYVGGRLGFNTNALSSKITYTDLDNNTTTLSGRLPGSTSISISPEVGYFVIDNLRISFSLGYELGIQQTDMDDNKWLKDKTQVFSFGPSLSYYIPLIEERLFYTPEIGIYGSFGSYKSDITHSTAITYGISMFSLRIHLIALEYTINSNFSAFATLGTFGLDTAAARSGDKDDPKINGTNVDFNLLKSASAGVRYYF